MESLDLIENAFGQAQSIKCIFRYLAHMASILLLRDELNAFRQSRGLRLHLVLLY